MDKQDFRKFYIDKVCSLHEWIFNNSEILYSKNLKMNLYKSHEAYVRAIVKINDDKKDEFINYLDWFNEMRSESLKLSPYDKKKNVPVFIENVANINISKAEAKTSQKVKPEEFYCLYRFPKEKAKEEINHHIDLYKKMGIEIHCEHSKIFASGSEIMKYANSDDIQYHHDSGTQYRLTIRKNGEQLSQRYKFGLIVLDTKPTIQLSNKEAKRAHSYQNPFLTVDDGKTRFFYNT